MAFPKRLYLANVFPIFENIQSSDLLNCPNIIYNTIHSIKYTISSIIHRLGMIYLTEIMKYFTITQICNAF